MTDNHLKNTIKAIAFYLPQFHPIPENDKWWGKGFTEWTNVKKATPKFKGHSQPKIPTDLGYYDLRSQDIRIAQADLAKQYGVSGFCYYHYWFNGKMLLEQPFNEVLNSGKPDYPFCLCWANEPWSRRWDGSSRDILMDQNYDNYSPDEHMAWLCKAFTDPRYIRVKEKPLFLIYNASEISELDNKIQDWRRAAKDQNINGIYLCAVLSSRNNLEDLSKFDFDCYTEFHPHPKRQGRTDILNFFRFLIPRIINQILLRLQNGVENMLTVTKIYSYERMVKNTMKTPMDPRVFPCVCPSWDNSPRKRVNSVILQNDNPKLYGEWLKNAVREIKKRPEDERIVFINAWNEWAEGCFLEPDQKHGMAFLEETKKALKL